MTSLRVLDDGALAESHVLRAFDGVVDRCAGRWIRFHRVVPDNEMEVQEVGRTCICGCSEILIVVVGFANAKDTMWLDDTLDFVTLRTVETVGVANVVRPIEFGARSPILVAGRRGRVDVQERAGLVADGGRCDTAGSVSMNHERVLGEDNTVVVVDGGVGVIADGLTTADSTHRVES